MCEKRGEALLVRIGVMEPWQMEKALQAQKTQATSGFSGGLRSSLATLART